MRNPKLLLTIGIGVLLGGLAACLVPESACDDYVDYICDCHPDQDCQQLRIIHQDAEGDELADCQIALDETQAEDLEDGHDCATQDTGG